MRTSEIVPHFGIFLLLLAAVIGLSFVLKEGAKSNHLSQHDVQCQIIDYYVSDGKIRVRVLCPDQVKTTVSDPSLVINILEHHLSAIDCKNLYASGDLEYCDAK